MNTYRLQLRPRHYGPSASLSSSLTEEAITKAVTDSLIRELSPGHHGLWTLDLQVDRPSHEAALNEIFFAVQQLGFEALNATVTEWADRAFEAAIAGALGGGTMGSLSHDSTVVGLTAVAGAAIGALAGSQMRRVERVYEIRTTASGWTLVPVSYPPSLGFDPSPSPA